MASRRAAEDDAARSLQAPLLYCPVRGPLTAAALAKDGLTPSEEARRVDLIKYLLHRKYPKENIAVETVVIEGLGESGRNTVRADVVVYECAAAFAKSLSQEERLQRALIVAEVKRDSSKKEPAISTQLKPALRQLPGMGVLGAYWDDVHRLLFTKAVVKKGREEFLEIREDALANLPTFGAIYEQRPIHVSTLTPPENLAATLLSLANVMRSHGLYDEHLRYKETVKLLLARYCDEKEAKESASGQVKLQVLPGADRDFRERVDGVYALAARRYHRAKTLFHPTETSELDDDTLREVVEAIQGINLSSASNDAMQEVFMSFVPALFKSSLDQYFTPVTLVDSMVYMVSIGPNDRIVDPAMGTADFLTAAMSYRADLGDDDAHQKVFGIDTDSQAFELAVINMILNRDGQANLKRGDSIEDSALWEGEMDVVLCNPPFGAKTVENRWEILRRYDLGHQWGQGDEGRWYHSGAVRDSQQLGILFIERSLRLLNDGGRLAIIVPEGYLCNPTYGYVRQWLLENARILALVELPRRIFTKSDVDLRSNILVAEKMAPERLADERSADYPIYADLIRKVGYKMGAGFSPIWQRDEKTGLEVRDEANEIGLDSDFPRLLRGFDRFRQSIVDGVDGDKWPGARVSDILAHPLCDMKPRRLMPRALENLRAIRGGEHRRLDEVAEVVEDRVDVVDEYGADALVRLVEGQDIRAVEGVAIPQQSERSWRVTDRKAKKLYVLRPGDIVVGLVRPERRNVGLLLVDDEGLLVGAPDGVAILRALDGYSQEWLFATLRSEACRIQFWTESGGTSYGKLSKEQIRDTVIPVGEPKERALVTKRVRKWAASFNATLGLWEGVGSDEDRKAIINSPAFGLESDWSALLSFDDD